MLSAALVDYALFTAKTLTILVLVGLLLLVLVRARRGHHPLESEHLEVVDLNQRYEAMARTLRHAALPKKAFHKRLKSDRKAEKQREKAPPGGRRVFVVDFHGDIKATEVTGLREVISAILLVAEAKDEVLVRLENAGGVVIEHGLAASQLARIRAKGLPLTVAVDKVAASGGYLMACVANRILAAPFAAVGSIGVVAQLPNFHRLLERHGVDFELLTAGEYKRTLTLFGENTEAGREKLREQLEDTHGLFKGFIAEYRPAVDLERVATGEYWHGHQALELGLVDELTTSDDYLMRACPEADLLLVSYATRKKPMERLLSSLGGTALRLLGR